jgi:hypothetical protein
MICLADMGLLERQQLKRKRNATPESRKKARVERTAEELPWKKSRRPLKTGLVGDDGILELEEVEGVEVVYGITEGGGRVAKFRVSLVSFALKDKPLIAAYRSLKATILRAHHRPRRKQGSRRRAQMAESTKFLHLKRQRSTVRIDLPNGQLFINHYNSGTPPGMGFLLAAPTINARSPQKGL